MPNTILSKIHIQDLLTERNLNNKLFEDKSIKFSDPISKHAAWMFKHIYSIPYKNTLPETIARFHHGIQHTSRAALYVPVFVNLYKRYKDPEALQLSEDDIKLLQIAALLHDAARMGEGIDEWDTESGIMTYAYLKDVLGVDASKAKLIAEAVTTNKEPHLPDSYVSLTVDDAGYYIRENTFLNQRNIYARIIQNVDCLDIIRTREMFNPTYLSFYRDIAIKNNAASIELTNLISEVTLLLKLQGDTLECQNYSLKSLFENENAYNENLKCLFTANFNPQKNRMLIDLAPADIARYEIDNVGKIIKDTITLELTRLNNPLHQSKENDKTSIADRISILENLKISIDTRTSSANKTIHSQNVEQTKKNLKDNLRLDIATALKNSKLDKYNSTQKCLLVLLNLITFIFAPIKRAVTGTWFYSIEGKSKSAVRDTQHTIDNFLVKSLNK